MYCNCLAILFAKPACLAILFAKPACLLWTYGDWYSWRLPPIGLWGSRMLIKRLQGCCILLLVFLLSNASGSTPETTIHTEAIVSESEVVILGGGHAYDHSDEGKRRSLATGSGLFCVAMQNADPTKLQAGLNWACGPGHANCGPIQPGGPCYKQNNIVALASYAYNDYYQRNANTGATCNFDGTAMTTPTDPSSGQCVFAGSSMAGGTTPAANAPTGLGPPSSFTPGFGNGSPNSILSPLDGAESVLSGARRALCVLLLALPLFFF